ncbi:E3 ubiquitin-protein ligase BOI-like [Triticum aestivum]|uniref:E3 ubiquitin-protein ligase BOI-like n=1 Tax=Triticum aestivum TaxID=4565 RepID=UPI001D02E4CB|nr:E3 ubiquitin-protein ligase BOI-like [Triticum aestivum]
MATNISVCGRCKPGGSMLQTRRLRAAKAALELARCRNAKLPERLSQICAEGQAWIRVAKSHKAVAAGLQATLDQLLQSPCAAVASTRPDEEIDAEDAPPPATTLQLPSVGGGVQGLGEGESCVLLLPCRHLCLCSACDAVVDTCQLCATMAKSEGEANMEHRPGS